MNEIMYKRQFGCLVSSCGRFNIASPSVGGKLCYTGCAPGVIIHVVRAVDPNDEAAKVAALREIKKAIQDWAEENPVSIAVGRTRS